MKNGLLETNKKEKYKPNELKERIVKKYWQQLIIKKVKYLRPLSFLRN